MDTRADMTPDQLVALATIEGVTVLEFERWIEAWEQHAVDALSPQASKKQHHEVKQAAAFARTSYIKLTERSQRKTAWHEERARKLEQERQARVALQDLDAAPIDILAAIARASARPGDRVTAALELIKRTSSATQAQALAEFVIVGSPRALHAQEQVHAQAPDWREIAVSALREVATTAAADSDRVRAVRALLDHGLSTNADAPVAAEPAVWIVRGYQRDLLERKRTRALAAAISGE
jgi:hypothetical protein